MSQQSVQVVGGGTMGIGIATACAVAGHRTAICDRSATLAEQAIAQARAQAERLAKPNGGAVAPIVATELASGAAGCTIAIEAVFEDFDVKVDVLRTLADAARPDALIATNTSSLSVAELARASGLGSRLVGVHFFQPADRSPLVEIVRASTDDSHVEQARAFAASLGRTAIVVDDAPGFLVNRLARPLYLEAERMLDEGFGAGAVDAVLRGVGLPIGPLEVVDRVGLEVHDAVTRSVYEELAAARLRPAPIVRRLLRAGRTGYNAGHGFHSYLHGRRVDPDPPQLPPPVIEGDAALSDRLRDWPTAVPADAPTLRVVDPAAVLAGLTRPDRDVVALPSPAVALEPGLATYVLAHQPFGLDALEISLSPAAPRRPAELLLAAAHAAGMKAAIVPRRGGLVAHRLLACFVNEAFLVLGEGYAGEDDVERAITLGLRHPHGPLGWVERFGGAAGVVATLDGLRVTAGVGYDAAPLLRERGLLEGAAAA
jgi:3-hydroxybutyryl-CoA dehydrogenase